MWLRDQTSKLTAEKSKRVVVSAFAQVSSLRAVDEAFGDPPRFFRTPSGMDHGLLILLQVEKTSVGLESAAWRSVHARQL